MYYIVTSCTPETLTYTRYHSSYFTFAGLDSNINEDSHDFIGVVMKYNNSWTSYDTELITAPIDPIGCRDWDQQSQSPLALTSDDQKWVVTLEFTNTITVSAINGVESDSRETCNSGHIHNYI